MARFPGLVKVLDAPTERVRGEYVTRRLQSPDWTIRQQQPIQRSLLGTSASAPPLWPTLFFGPDRIHVERSAAHRLSVLQSHQHGRAAHRHPRATGRSFLASGDIERILTENSLLSQVLS